MSENRKMTEIISSIYTSCLEFLLGKETTMCCTGKPGTTYDVFVFDHKRYYNSDRSKEPSNRKSSKRQGLAI